MEVHLSISSPAWVTDLAHRVLEVGALKPDNYASCSSWMDVTPIDLHSRHPSILEQDFLSMDEDENKEKWDLVCLSLVVNFVPDPKDRGPYISP
jgi:25S rRNA (adenine2142-N1)-methyltransferase